MKYYPDPNMKERSYGPDVEFWICEHCDLDPWVMGNNCVKYDQDPTRQKELWPEHRYWVCMN